MRAIVCPALGVAPAMADIAPPPLVPGRVRIAVAAAGVNFADTLMVAGTYQDQLPPPFVPGFELAGTVLETASDAAGCRPGDTVLAVVPGGAFAEQAVAEAGDVHVLPAGADTTAAAAIAVVYGTAHMALTAKAALAPGETLVVHGAGSGVGLAAVEIGATLGARVIATAGDAEKRAAASARGAAETLDSRAEDMREQIKALTGGRGADIVFDPVGGPLFEASLRATAPGGRILVIGFASGRVPQIAANLLLVKNLTVIGFAWGAWRRLDPAALRRSLAEVLAWWGQGRLQPPLATAMPLERAADALALIAARKVTGKIVLTV
jgi:NADPH2:quinone reductase